MTGFVIVVDMQHDFVRASGALPVPEAEAIVVPMEHWLASLDPRDVAGVLMTFDTHAPADYAGSAEAEQFPIHCEKGTPGWESVLDTVAINAAIPIYTLEKSVFDMWQEEDLKVLSVDGTWIEREAFFRALSERGVDRVIVVGVAADYCVRWAVEGLLTRGFAVEIPASLTRGIGKDAHAVAQELGHDDRLSLAA
ncbi:MAG: isochorismatase family cysteine hydrolase [Novosphingobium sp.]